MTPSEHERNLRAATERSAAARRGGLNGGEQHTPYTHISSLTATSRAFLASMRVAEDERQRIKEERTRLLEREKQARAEAESSRQQIANILESISDAFFALDKEWRFTYVNRKAERLWGRSRGELLGKNVPGVFPRLVGTEGFEALERAAREGVTTGFETFSPGLDAWISGRVYPSADGLSVYLQDITEQKRAEEERDRLLAREWVAQAEVAERERISRELHDRVAHEMGVVHQSLELYEKLLPREPARARTRLKIAKEMTKAALDSTRKLSAELRCSEAEDGLQPALQNLLEITVPQHVGTQLSVEGDESLVQPPLRSQLYLIVREAVRNAVAHAGCGRITVKLNISPEGISGSVEDDGYGFDADGWYPAGLGLRSMKERAALLGGDLRLVSQPEDGTTVRVFVPLGRER